MNLPTCILESLQTFFPVSSLLHHTDLYLWVGVVWRVECHGEEDVTVFCLLQRGSTWVIDGGGVLAAASTLLRNMHFFPSSAGGDRPPPHSACTCLRVTICSIWCGEDVGFCEGCGGPGFGSSSQRQVRDTSGTLSIQESHAVNVHHIYGKGITEEVIVAWIQLPQNNVICYCHLVKVEERSGFLS